MSEGFPPGVPAQELPENQDPDVAYMRDDMTGETTSLDAKPPTTNPPKPGNPRSRRSARQEEATPDAEGEGK